MKFYVGLVTAVFLMAGTASAQHVNFGVKGGLNLYSIKNDNNTQYNTKTGFHLGMLLHVHVAPHFAVQPELLYSAQGARYNTDNGDINLKLEYANVPFMFQYMFDNGFRLEAGPQVGFLTNAKAEMNGVSADVKSTIKKVDFAIGLGIGYIAPTGFGIDARYNHGLSNINENGSVNSYNRGFQLGLLYQFEHK